MNTDYDVLVIGAGPGGAVAAKTTAEQGLRTCIIEKRPAIGTPVRCAEAIGKNALSRFIDPDNNWISAEISEALIISPEQTELYLDSSGIGNKKAYILERKIFDRALVEQAVAAGADIFIKTGAKSPIIYNGMIKGAKTSGQFSHIRANVVIAADGIESQFSRWCGIDTSIKPEDILSCAQYLLTDININPVMNIFYYGNSIAPGGYLWIFPKGERTANVGVGILGSKSKKNHQAKDFLDHFISQRFPKGKAIEFIAGGVPVSRPLPTTVSDGLIIVGDAARIVDPFAGGGLQNAMYTGMLAGETAIESISKGDYSKVALMSYDKKWRQSSFGASLEQNYLIKERFGTFSDEKINKLLRTAKSQNIEGSSMLEIIKGLEKLGYLDQ